MANRLSTVNIPNSTKPTTPSKRPQSSTTIRPASRGNQKLNNNNNASNENLVNIKKKTQGKESLGWTDVDHEADAKEGTAIFSSPSLQIDAFKELNGLGVEDCVMRIATLIGVSSWKDDLKGNIRVSYCHQAYMFAKENGFTDLQKASFFTLMKGLLDKCIDRGYTVERMIHIFRAVTLNLVSSLTFDYNQLELITEFVLTTVFQHFRLYKLVLSTDQVLKTIQITLPPAPQLTIPPLSQAITLEEYNAEREAKLKIEQEEQAEKTRKEEEERLARAANPLHPLTEDEIKILAAQSVSGLLEGVLCHVKQIMREKEAKYLQLFSKYE